MFQVKKNFMKLKKKFSQIRGNYKPLYLGDFQSKPKKLLYGFNQPEKFNLVLEKASIHADGEKRFPDWKLRYFPSNEISFIIDFSCTERQF